MKDLIIVNVALITVLTADLALLISALHSISNLQGVLRLFRVAILVLYTVKLQWQILQAWSLFLVTDELHRMMLQSESAQASKIEEVIQIIKG